MGKKESLSGWDDRFKSPAYWIAVVGGAGLLRPAPGTWGSLVTVLLLWLAAQFSLPYSFHIVGFVAITIIGTLAINNIEKQTGVHDAPEIVIDEVAGQWIALLPVFWALSPESGSFLPSLIAQFLLFRLFDIWKPWPIGWLDRRVKGGFGVMIDDIVAGLLAVIVLMLLVHTLL